MGLTGSAPGKALVPYHRRAHHAGSWYSNDAEELGASLLESLRVAEADSSTSDTAGASVRAVVCPHAGYSYSGTTAAYSYLALQKELQRRKDAGHDSSTTIVVLHPSHHVYLRTCAVSGAAVLETPLGNLKVDDALRQEILQSSTHTTKFTIMTKSDDEHEHSGEMQYPFLAKIMAEVGANSKVLPIMCGALSDLAEAAYGRVLSSLLQRPTVLTVVSTDFCHWGSRFRYQPMPPTGKPIPIHEFIKSMDHRGMELMAKQWQQPGAFADYLRDTGNTICGRHAVAVWLHALAIAYPHNHSNLLPNVSFVKYNQSSSAKSIRDSSVSYAAGVCTLPF